MNYLEVIEHEPPSGSEFMVTGYPGPGLYVNTRTQMLMAVTASVMSLGLASQYPFKESGGAADHASTPAMSEGFVLKLVALVQQPQLAVSLLPTKVA